MSKMFKSSQEVDKNTKKIDIKFILKEFFFSFTWLFLLLLLGDIITKVVAENLLVQGEPISIIPGLLNFSLVYNKGAAWGMGGDATWSRILLACTSWIVAIAIIFYFIYKYKTLDKFLKAILMVILAGDVGNLIDRTFFYNRGVIDFLDITPLIPGFGIFNFADSCLVVGIILLIIYFIIEFVKEKKKENLNKKIVEEKIKDDDKK